MRNLKIKLKISTITLILLLTFAAIFVALPIIKAQDKPSEVPTYIYVSVSPNPIGVAQVVYVNAFLSKPAPTTGLGGSGDRYENITVEMIDPEGGKTVFGPYLADAVGGIWLSYTPDKVGEYTFQAFYPGQYLEEVVPGLFGPPDPSWIGSYMQPSVSEVVTLVVQADPVTPIYETPSLPDEYWSRPIYSTNWGWGQLGGSWFGLAAPAFATTGNYDATGNFQPYSEAPNTAHIMWTKPTHFGGQPGLPISSDQMSQYMSTTIATNFFEPVILNGILYYTHVTGPTAVETSWEAVDLRTGETLWSREPGITGNEVVRMGQILRFHAIQEYGSWAFLYGAETAAFFGGGNFYNIYDPMSGEFIANITSIQNVPYMMDFEEEQQGTILAHYTSGGNLFLWNSTKLMMSASFDQITIRPMGTYDWASGVEWSVPLPTELNGIPISLMISARTPEVILLRQQPSPGMFVELSYGYQIAAGYDPKTGYLIWGPINQTIPYLQDVALVAAGEGVYVLHNKDTNEAYGYSLGTGNFLWGPVKLVGTGWSHLARSADIAYGMVYIWDLGGYCTAIDLQTGEIQWTFTRGSAGYDTPFGVYPLWYNDAIADGKIYLSEGTMYTPPLHPARTVCINATSGELIWSILSYSGRVPPAIADGYMVIWNSFDNQIYTFGKGPSKTTVSAGPKVTTWGSSVVIEGTVTDESPGTKDYDRKARFPNGVPAIADEYMSEWMEYVYMQQVCPEFFTGVEVVLETLDPNNNFYEIGRVTTDAYGMFKLLWEPPVPGEYTIIATFEGSDSYWHSYAETAIGVTEAPSPAVPIEPEPTEPEPTEPEPTESEPPSPAQAIEPEPTEPAEAPLFSTTDLAIIAAVAVAVVIGIAAYWALRKRK